MKVIQNWQDVPDEAVDMEGVQGARKRLLLGPDDATPLMALRVFTLDAGGHTPLHDHPFEHLNVILEGEGVIRTPEGDHPISPGSVALILPGETHQFRNAGEGRLAFVCLVPNDYA